MRSAKITFTMYALIITSTILIFSGCGSSKKYYPEFGETITRKEARERYRDFKARQDNDGIDAEQEAIANMEEIRMERASILDTRQEFELPSDNLETTTWDYVTFNDGTYMSSDGDRFTGKLLSLYPNGIPQLSATVIDGKLNGKAKEYFPNGSTKIIKNYYQGFLVDTLIEYFSTGEEKLKAIVVNQSTRGGDEVRNIKVGFFEDGEYQTKYFREGRLQFINKDRRSDRTHLAMPIEDQRGYMLFDRGMLGERLYTANSQTITAPLIETTGYENSIVQGKMLASTDLQEDALMLKKVMLDVHPGIYRYNTEGEFEAHFQDFYAKLDRDMTEAEFMKHLAQFTEKVRCGHTYVNPWNMRKEIRERLFGGNIYFPFGFEILDGNMYITKNASNNFDIKIGAEILSINGFSTTEILDSLYTVAKIDGSNIQAKDKILELAEFGERDHNFFDFYFPLFFPLQDEVFEVQVQNFDSNVIINHKQPSLSRAERLEIMNSRYGEAPTGIETWSVDIQDDLAILNLGTFATWNINNFDASQFYDSAFTLINQSGVDNLVIDIRGNGGGLTENADLLLSYLSDGKVPCADVSKQLIVTTKADSSYFPYVETWEKIIFQGIPEAYTRPYNDRYIELMEGGCEPIQPSEKAFNGEVFILGNQSNVSATFTLLNIIQKENLGTYVGLPSGGNKQGINGGSYFFLYLPNSQFEVDIPLKFSSYGEDIEDGYLTPDVWVDITQEDIALQNDPYLDKVRELIEN